MTPIFKHRVSSCGIRMIRKIETLADLMREAQFIGYTAPSLMAAAETRHVFNIGAVDRHFAIIYALQDITTAVKRPISAAHVKKRAKGAIDVKMRKCLKCDKEFNSIDGARRCGRCRTSRFARSDGNFIYD